MAQAHAGLGCRVTVIEAGRIAGREDPELADGLRAALAGNGVDPAGRRARSPAPSRARRWCWRTGGGSRARICWSPPGGGRTSRRSALEAGGVRAGPAGIATDAGLRSLTNRRVFAVGDIADPAGIGPRAFTHVGSYHAAIVIRRALFRLPARVDYAALPRVIYTDPELAQVGLTEAEARAAGHEVRMLRWPLAENDRAQAERRTEGLVKLVTTRRGRVLGAGILAPHAGEMIGLWTLGDRPAHAAVGAGRADRALSDAGRGRQAGRRNVLYGAAVRAGDQTTGAAAGVAGVSKEGQGSALDPPSAQRAFARAVAPWTPLLRHLS